MSKVKNNILWFEDIGIKDVSIVGGKNASLGEMYSNLTRKGIKIPNGFAITAQAYQYFIKEAGIEQKIKDVLADLDTHNMKNLMARGAAARGLILGAKFPMDLEREILGAYKKLAEVESKVNKVNKIVNNVVNNDGGSAVINHINFINNSINLSVAVRSSATAEDLPDASFAGQQETYLNIRGERDLLLACRKCFASLFTNRAISYREDKGFDHFKVFLSIGVQKMIRADKGASGVMFTIDTESGFRDVVLVNAIYGLGENIVQGKVTPDEYYVFKPTLKQGFEAIISKKPGDKKIKMIYGGALSKKPTRNVKVNERERKKYAISDGEVLKLAEWAVLIEEYYSKIKNQKLKIKNNESLKIENQCPMDIEWVKDGVTGELYIVQARPETVQARRDVNVLEEYRLQEKGRVLIQGKSVGNRIGAGKVKVIQDVRGINTFGKGEVLVTEMTNPDWEPIMKIAAGIVTNSGGRTCFSGETKILTNEGFMEIKDIVEQYKQDAIRVLSLDKDNLKVEWNNVVDGFERSADTISISISQTGRMKDNILKLTPDHKVLTFKNRQLVSKEIQDLIQDGEHLLSLQRIPALNKKKFDFKLAYLLGAIWTDGSIYLTNTHGEIQFIQKETRDKRGFIKKVNDYFEDVFDYRFRKCFKKERAGLIRGRKIIGSATAYRCYSKERAQRFIKEKEMIFEKVLTASDEFLYNFLAGAIDGDGTYNQKSSRINIFCSDKELLKAVVISCLRLDIAFTIVKNRTISNIQIVSKIDEIFKYTARVKGKYSRKVMGIKLFSARQLLEDIKYRVNYLGRILPYINNNFLIDGEKVLNNLIPMIKGEPANHELTKIVSSDLKMLRAVKAGDLFEGRVYNITVEDNHNYVVFTNRYTPIIVNNCHAAIVSRELGIPCIVGTENGTRVLKQGQEVTVDCSGGEQGFVYQGRVKYDIKKTNLKTLKRPKTKIMMNVGNPEEAMRESFIPNDGVGLAREEFIITSYIGVHPMALIEFDKVKDKTTRRLIEEKTKEYKNKMDYYVYELAEGIAQIAAAYFPKDVIVRFSDFKTNEYATLLGGKYFEPSESNPMIGWRGASRYYDPKFKPAFELECLAIKRVREVMGLVNVKVMIPFCRTIEEGKKVLKIMEGCGLKRPASAPVAAGATAGKVGKDGLEIYVMCEIPSNVILAEEFAQIFDGFSIGSNDLTQLCLGVDRDSEIVAHVYDERNQAVKDLVSRVIEVARKNGKKIGICGQAPSDFPDFAQFLVECGIDSISLNPDTVVKTTLAILEKERALGR